MPYEDNYLFTFSGPQMMNKKILVSIDDHDNYGKLDNNMDDFNNEICGSPLKIDVIENNFCNENEKLVDENHNPIFDGENPTQHINISVHDNENYDTKEPVNEDIDSDLHAKTIQFMFSKPDYVDDNETPPATVVIDKKSDDKIQKCCKKCWIFNKPNCKECLEKQISTNPVIPTVDIADNEINSVNKQYSEPCHFCWLFKNVPRCECCKKINEDKADTVIECETNVSNVIKYNVCEESGTNIESKNENQGAKRKAQDKETEIKVKRTKWQCDVCLVINNSDREKCICCEGKQSLKDPIKINFGLKNSFHNAKKINETSNAEPISINSVESIQKPNETEHISMEKTIIEPEKMEETITSNLESVQQVNFISFENEKMNIFDDEAKTSEIYMSSYCNELMDVTIEDNEIYLPSIIPTNIFPNPFSIPNIQPNFQFNIGIVPKSNTRKFKKPQRRLTPAFHK